MIESIRAYKKKLRSISPTFLAMEWFKENKDKLVYAQLRQWYDWGEDNKGQKIGEYTDFTKKLKREKGVRYDHVTLRDTGDFYSSIFVEFGVGEFKMNSSDPKFRSGKPVKTDWSGGYYQSRSIVDQYSEDVLGLNESSISLLRDELKYYLDNKIRSVINAV